MISAPGTRDNLPTHSELSIVEQDLLRLENDSRVLSMRSCIWLRFRQSPHSWSNLLQAHAVNLTATRASIELAQQLQIRRIVYASSAAVYGDADVVPIGEMQRLRRLLLMACKKSRAKSMAAFVAGKNLSFVALRFFNVFGPRQVAGSPYSGVITIFAQAMRENQTDHNFWGGGQTRDFVYVKDIALGIASALEIRAWIHSRSAILAGGTAVYHPATVVDDAPIFSGMVGLGKGGAGTAGRHCAFCRHISGAAQRLLSYRPRYSPGVGSGRDAAAPEVAQKMTARVGKGVCCARVRNLLLS